MLSPDQLEHGLSIFEALVREDPVLREEFRRSTAQYFTAGQSLDPATPEGVSAAHRHLEWFLFERVTDPVRELPAEQLLERWRARVEPELAEQQEAFLESHAGIFAVTDVDPGKGAWLQDLAGLGQYPVVEAEASRLLAKDDLIVGRLYPVGESVYRISRGAGFFREPNLVRALEDDMRRLRKARTHMVLRIAQRELEATFWGASRPHRSADPVGDARRLLASGGVLADEVDDLLDALEASPPDPTHPTPGIGDTLARVLEQLAFHTSVDLGLAQRQLLLAWQHFGERALVQREEVSEEVDDVADGDEVDEVRRAVAELDRSLRSGQEVNSSFDELERALGLDEVQDEEDLAARREALAELENDDEEEAEEVLEEGDRVPDFPGVVGAMVEEFLWEAEVLATPWSTPQADLLRLFAKLERNLGVFEELSRRDVMRFATFWLPESGALGSADRADAALDVLVAFCLWAEETHALPHLEGSHEQLVELRDNLRRVTAANQSLGRSPNLSELGQRPDERAGELYELLADLGQGRARVRDARSRVHELRTNTETMRLLEAGDRFRASLDDERLVIHCCYPPEIAQLAAERNEER